jgi:hypothetical protein
MSAMTVERGANASTLAGAVAAMAVMTLVASVGLYVAAVRSQPDDSRPATEAAAVKTVVLRPAPVPKVAPHAEWMDRAIRANP